MIKLYNTHEDLRDQFEILAFHDATAKTFDELDEKLESTIEQAWNGEPLPFPILLDATGETIKNFGIAAYPTVVLINPEGKLVRGGEHALEKILEEKAREAAGRPSE